MADIDEKAERLGTHIGLPPAHEQAAQFIAEGRLTTKKIAEHLAIGRTTLFRWRREPDFALRVDEIRKTIATDFDDLELASKKGRARFQAEVHERLWRIADARAVDPTMKTIPGGETGFMVLEYKQIGGKGLIEAKLDVGLIREIRATEDQISKELGQLTEKTEINITGAVRELSDDDLNTKIAELRDRARRISVARAAAAGLTIVPDSGAATA
jgi:hypothetical protein